MDRSDDPSHHERTLLPQSYISLPWMEREIAQWVHHEGSIRRSIAPRSYISLPYCFSGSIISRFSDGDGPRGNRSDGATSVQDFRLPASERSLECTKQFQAFSPVTHRSDSQGGGCQGRPRIHLHNIQYLWKEG